jgi:hypothetical protein
LLLELTQLISVNYLISIWGAFSRALSSFCHLITFFKSKNYTLSCLSPVFHQKAPQTILGGFLLT